MVAPKKVSIAKVNLFCIFSHTRIFNVVIFKALIVHKGEQACQRALTGSGCAYREYWKRKKENKASLPMIQGTLALRGSVFPWRWAQMVPLCLLLKFSASSSNHNR